jgi:hypothetical protein
MLARLVGVYATLPSGWLLLGMHDSDDVENTWQELVEDHVREALHQLAPKLAVDDGSFFGIVLESREGSTKVIAKALAQAFATALIESESGERVSFGFWAENDPNHVALRDILARTVSHELPTGPSRSSKSSRRSSSVCCSGVRAKSSGLRLPHRSSMSSNFSSGVSEVRSSAGLAMTGS